MTWKAPRVTNSSDDFLTPPEIVRSLGSFDLDPCASHYQDAPLAAQQYRWPEQDGLLLPWSGRVWCNPPYGQAIHKWCSRFVLHANGVLLVPARMETRWFQSLWTHASAVLMPLGRICYWEARVRKFKPAHIWGDALFAFGNDNVTALRKCATGGILVEQFSVLKSSIHLTRSAKGVSLSSVKEDATNERKRTSNGIERSRQSEGTACEKESQQNIFSQNEENGEDEGCKVRPQTAHQFPCREGTEDVG